LETFNQGESGAIEYQTKNLRKAPFGKVALNSMVFFYLITWFLPWISYNHGALNLYFLEPPVSGGSTHVVFKISTQNKFLGRAAQY